MNATPFGMMLAALALGLLSGVHCGTMCGGLLAAISHPPQRYRAALHAGRIASYALAGAAAGALGATLMHGAHALHMLFMLVANLLLITAGINLAGIAAATRALEHLGAPLWRALQPLLRHALPLNSAPRALLAGAVWGWLPCGMVYAVLPSALAAGDAASGALLMLLFGIGTLPNLLALSFVWGRLQASHSLARVRLGAGLAVSSVGIVGLALAALHAVRMYHLQ